MKFIAEENEEPRLQIAPLIDIIFLMLIFFITTSALESFEKDVSIDLPKADIPALAAAPQVVYVEVEAGGKVKLEGREIAPDELSRRLKALAKVAPELKVVIRADARLPWQRVVDVIETVTKAGINRLYYSITGRKTAPAPVKK